MYLRRVNDPDFMIASSSDGTVYYYSKDKNLKYGYTQEIEEDYQTALRIVRESKQEKGIFNTPPSVFFYPSGKPIM